MRCSSSTASRATSTSRRRGSTACIERKPRVLLKAVDGVDLTIRRGETLGLVGESGCGKSTVARLIVGLYAPTRGTIRYDGVVLAGEGAQHTDAAARRARAAQHADDLPGSVREPESALARRRHRRRAAARRRTSRSRSATSKRARARCSRRSASRRSTAASIRTSSPAASASASRSRARSRRTRRSWCATSRRRRSTSRCRRRC